MNCKTDDTGFFHTIFLCRKIMKTILKYTVLFFAMGILSTAVKGQQYNGKYLVNVNSEGVILDGYDPVAFLQIINRWKAIRQLLRIITMRFIGSRPKNIRRCFRKIRRSMMYNSVVIVLMLFLSVKQLRSMSIHFPSSTTGSLFQHNMRAVNAWEKDVTGNLSKADKYWPAVSKKAASKLKQMKRKNSWIQMKTASSCRDTMCFHISKIQNPKKGSPDFTTRYNGATYWFMSQEHADKFKDSPEKYVPQYGAFCGYAVSLNKLRR